MNLYHLCHGINDILHGINALMLRHSSALQLLLVMLVVLAVAVSRAMAMLLQLPLLVLLLEL